MNKMKKMTRHTTSLALGIAFLLNTLLSGCGGGGGGGGSGPGAAALAPTVTTVTPGDGATNVALNTKIISAIFSKAMDPLTLTNTSFTLECPTATPFAGVVSYAGTTATLTLPALPNLPPSVICTATITTAAQDTTAKPLAANYVWTFTTGLTIDATAPTIIATGAFNGEVGLPINRDSTATFSEAMDPTTLASPATSFTITCVLPCVSPVPGVVSYVGNTVTFNPDVDLLPNTTYTSTISIAAKDLAGNALAAGVLPNPWSWTTGATGDVLPPTVGTTNPIDLGTGICINKTVNATFSEAMDASTISITTFTLQLKGPPLGLVLAGVVTYDVATKVASFNPTADLLPNTDYTATITIGAKDVAGNAMTSSKVWNFTTGTGTCVTAPALGLMSTFGTFGGTAGMTSTGIQTMVGGDIGTTATATSSITGFHDTGGDIYTETLGANVGAVNGIIYTCTNSTTGPTSAGVNAAYCAVATQGAADALAAYNALVAKPPGANPGGNLAGLTLAPGVYTAPAGSFLIEGNDLTLDAQGDADAVWVFQMSTTLTVGGPGAAFPQSVVLSGGAQAKNVFWQVGSFATINAGGGGIMQGNIISQAGASFSTAGNTTIVVLNGRVISLGASVTLVDTVINLP